MWAASRRAGASAACSRSFTSVVRSAFTTSAAASGKAKATAVSRVRGTRDLLAEDAEQHQQVLQVLQRTVGSYGFRPHVMMMALILTRVGRCMQIQTPLLEYTDLFSRSLGDGSDIVMKVWLCLLLQTVWLYAAHGLRMRREEVVTIALCIDLRVRFGLLPLLLQEMYTFKDNSGKSVTLRPEGTAGIIRALLSNNLMFSLPQKVTYSGSMFRYERPQRGRYREFQQFGVEFVGSSGPSVDVEVIAMAADALQALGIRSKAVLELNSLGDAESRGRYRVALEEYFSQYKSELSADSINRLERGSVLRILDSKSEEDKKFVADAPCLEAYLSTEASARFDAVLSGLEALGIRYRHNARLVRGLDYYSHTVFEFVENLSSTDDEGEAGSGGIAVLAGGCYDNLSETLGGPPVSCIGWAAGVDRLHLLRETSAVPSNTIAVVPVLVGDDHDAVLHEAMRVAHTLRQRGLTVHFCHGRGSLKKQMKAAEKSGCLHAVILGSEEVQNKFVKVKNLEKRQEEQVALVDLDAFQFCK